MQYDRSHFEKIWRYVCLCAWEMETGRVHYESPYYNKVHRYMWCVIDANKCDVMIRQSLTKQFIPDWEMFSHHEFHHLTTIYPELKLERTGLNYDSI